jgi:hypothetical protein
MFIRTDCIEERAVGRDGKPYKTIIHAFHVVRVRTYWVLFIPIVRIETVLETKTR